MSRPRNLIFGAMIGAALFWIFKVAIIVTIGYFVLSAFGAFDAKAGEQPQSYTVPASAVGKCAAHMSAPGFSVSTPSQDCITRPVLIKPVTMGVACERADVNGNCETQAERERRLRSAVRAEFLLRLFGGSN